MMNSSLLADLFDLEEGEVLFEETVVVKDEKKATKTKAEKAAEKATVTLPCKVVGSAFEVVVEGEGEIKATELVDKLAELGYIEVLNSSTQVFVPEDLKSTAYVVANPYLNVTEKDTLIDLAEGKKVYFAFGMEKLEFSLTDFPDAEDGEVTLDMVTSKVYEAFPRYKGIRLAYDVESNTVALDLSGAKAANSVTYPLTVIVKGEEVVKLEGPEKVSELIAELTTDFAHAKLTVALKQSADENVYLLCFTSHGTTVSAGNKSNKGAEVKKKETKYTLPLKICILALDKREELTSDAFGGKEKITKADIVEYYKGQGYSFFNDTKRVDSMDLIYEKSMGLLTIGFKSGTRGAFISPSWAYEEREVYARPHLDANEVFECLTTTRTAYNAVIEEGAHALKELFCNETAYYIYTWYDSLFLAKAGLKKRVPKSVLDGVVEYFRKELPNEAICRIVYDKRTKSYNIQTPTKGKKTGVTVKAEEYPTIGFYENLIMEIHSHNVMPAFWSRTDDAAELNTIGIYGVIGNLDTKNPSMLFRGCYEGSKHDIELADLFSEV